MVLAASGCVSGSIFVCLGSNVVCPGSSFVCLGNNSVCPRNNVVCLGGSSVSIDKKLNSNGQKVLELGNTALNNKDFNIAIKCFDYIIKNSSSLEIKFEAKNKRLITFKTKLLNGSKIIKEELEELKANYLQF